MPLAASCCASFAARKCKNCSDRQNQYLERKVLAENMGKMHVLSESAFGLR